MLVLRGAVLVLCVSLGSTKLALSQQNNKTIGSADKSGDVHGGAPDTNAVTLAKAAEIHICYKNGSRIATESPNANVDLNGEHAYLSYEDGKTLVYVANGTAKLSGKGGLKQSVTLAQNEVGTVDADGSARVAHFYGPACPGRNKAETFVGGGGVAGNAGLVTWVLWNSGNHPASPSK